MRSVRSKSKETSKSSPVTKARGAGVDQISAAFVEEGRSSPVQQVSISGDVPGISTPKSKKSVKNEGENNMLSNPQRNITKKGGGRDDGGSVLSSSGEMIRADTDPLELFRSPKTFRGEVRAQLLSVFKSILSENDHLWRVMVLDERATRVISSIVGMYDIVEAARVTCVENLFLARQPFTEVRVMDEMKVVVILGNIYFFNFISP